MKPIYLDYHATTPVAPEVLEAMLPWFTEDFGNPASRSHAYGWRAKEAVELARAEVAAIIGAEPSEIYFNSGSTEGLNMAIKGLAEAFVGIGKHIVTVTTEHSAVIDSLNWLGKRGYEITTLPVNHDGLLDLSQLRDAIRDDTFMVSMMWANNETGVIQAMAEIGKICKQKGIPLISDATQAFGKIEINPTVAGVDILSVSGHKIYGPKGIGALYINKKLKQKPKALIHGGGHESGFRSGTLNVPGIVGLGKAAVMAKNNLDNAISQVGILRNHLETNIFNGLESVSVNGHLVNRLPTVTNLAVAGVDSQAVMSRFRSRLAISSGSACSSDDPSPSHVLLAMGLSPAEAKSSFRFSLGMPTTKDDIDQATQIFIEAVKAERAGSPLWQMMKSGIDLSD